MTRVSKSIFDNGETATVADSADYAKYRQMCGLAVASLMAGLLSLPSLIFPVLLFIPVVGVVIGLIAVLQIRRRSHELMGMGVARLGLAMCVCLLIGGSAYHTRVYMTEVPDGFQRVSFLQLQPDKDRPDLPVAPLALELNDKPVFIKGYIYPGDKKSRLDRFVLVPDMGTCCFGGQPKLTDMIEVILDEPLMTNWSTRRRRVAGTLMVDKRLKPVSGVNGVYYRLKATFLDGKFADK